MPTKIITLKKAISFAINNGYLLAVYKKDGEQFVLCEDGSIEDIDYCSEIEVKTVGGAIDFNEFPTVDGEYLFKLHNNFNIPKTRPLVRINSFAGNII